VAVGSPVVRRANVCVRPAVAADALAVADLLLPFEPSIPSAFPVGRAGRGARAEHKLSVESAAEHLQTRFDDPLHHVLVATDTAQPEAPVVGVVVARFEDAGLIVPTPVLAVGRLAVAPRLRRRGIGRALLTACIELSESAGVQYLQSVSHPSARDANRYLARVGFAAIATRRMAPVPTVRRALGLPSLGLVVAGTDGRPARRLSRRVVPTATTVHDIAHPGA
jgi:predicted N-acetyltransferase YhbS